MSLTVKGKKNCLFVCFFSVEDLSQLPPVSWEKTLLPNEYNKIKGNYGGLLELIL